MDRREFLRLVGIAGTVPLLPRGLFRRKRISAERFRAWLGEVEQRLAANGYEPSQCRIVMSRATYDDLMEQA